MYKIDYRLWLYAKKKQAYVQQEQNLEDLKNKRT